VVSSSCGKLQQKSLYHRKGRDSSRDTELLISGSLGLKLPYIKALSFHAAAAFLVLHKRGALAY